VEIAKLTSKGQITIPIDIRRKLDIKEGDKVLFVEKNGNIIIMNSTMSALKKAQSEFEGEAEKANLKNEEDVANMIKELRE
jgi:antitoxin PrlF